MFGTSGMRLLSDRLIFNPPPPSATGGHATSINMRFNYQQSLLSQTVTDKTVEFELLRTFGAAPKRLVLLKADGKTQIPLELGNKIVVARSGTLAILVS